MILVLFVNLVSSLLTNVDRFFNQLFNEDQDEFTASISCINSVVLKTTEGYPLDVNCSNFLERTSLATGRYSVLATWLECCNC